MRYVSVVLAAVAVVALSAGSAHAAPIVLDFEGIGNLTSIGSFYNGGAGGNLGVEFSAGSESLVDADAGGSGNFSNNPSGSSIAFFDWDRPSMTMNVADGFLDSLSFQYTSLYFPGLVSIWDGVNGTGQLLGIAALPRLTSNCGGAPGDFNCWSSVALDFSGTGKIGEVVGRRQLPRRRRCKAQYGESGSGACDRRAARDRYRCGRAAAPDGY